MKNLFYLFFLLLAVAACTKGDDTTLAPEIKEIDKLPPATQTGANKVGCLVNGKAFLPVGNSPGSVNPYCGYYHDRFALVFRIVKDENNIAGNGTESVAIYSSDTILEENNIYILKNSETNKRGAYSIISRNSSSSLSYETDADNIGELYITKLDKANNIISGTFWFDAVNAQGKKVEIREGRFDMIFESWAG